MSVKLFQTLVQSKICLCLILLVLISTVAFCVHRHVEIDVRSSGYGFVMTRTLPKSFLPIKPVPHFFTTVTFIEQLATACDKKERTASVV